MFCVREICVPTTHLVNFDLDKHLSNSALYRYAKYCSDKKIDQNILMK